MTDPCQGNVNNIVIFSPSQGSRYYRSFANGQRFDLYKSRARFKPVKLGKRPIFPGYGHVADKKIERF